MEDEFAPCDTKIRFHTCSILHHIPSIIRGLSAPSTPPARKLIGIVRNKNTSLVLDLPVVSALVKNIIHYQILTYYIV